MSPSILYALVRVTSQRACSGRDVDVESGSVDTGWGREGDRMNWEIGIDIYTVPGARQRAGGDMLSTAGSSAQRSTGT